MQLPIRVAVLGFGARGRMFADLVRRDPIRAEVVAVADPRPQAREAAAALGLARERIFDDWQAFCTSHIECDAVVVATMDREHVGPAIASLERGHHVLLEKPMAVSLDDCRAITRAQRQHRGLLSVCHSLRYAKSFALVKSLISEGRIGRVMSIDQLEGVGYFHHAHAFVRGNWRREDTSTFMLMAKCCHDVDYMVYLAGQPVRRVSSFGSLGHFTRENAPEGAGERCTDCAIEARCAYSARDLYGDGKLTAWVAGGAPAASAADARARRIADLATSPLGRCVYRTDNDVVDHQVVAMEFADGATATLTMTAFTQIIGRRVRVHGTAGEIEFAEGALEPGDRIVLRTWSGDQRETIDVGPDTGTHGGGDARVVHAWLSAISSGDPSQILTGAEESLASHTVVFAAEAARRSGTVEDLSNWR